MAKADVAQNMTAEKRRNRALMGLSQSFFPNDSAGSAEYGHRSSRSCSILLCAANQNGRWQKSPVTGEREGNVCRGKARFLRGCKSLPARVAPAGSNRSRREGNELSEAFDGKGH